MNHTATITDQDRAEIIRKEVYNYLNVPADQPGRKREAVEARYFTMYYCKHYTRLSLARIGMLFGKDHSTVIHACKTARNLIDYNGFQVKDGRMRFHIERELIILDGKWMEGVAQL